MLVTNGFSINNIDKFIYNKCIYHLLVCCMICLSFETGLEVNCETKKFLRYKFEEVEMIIGIRVTISSIGLKLSPEH